MENFENNFSYTPLPVNPTENVSESSIKQPEIVEPNRTIQPEEIEKWNSDGYKVETYGPDVSVVVLGEYHYDKDMKAKQVELIKAIKPEFVLYEGLSGFVYDPTKKSLERQEGRLFMDGYDGEHFKSPKEMEFINVITSSADEVGCNVVGCDLTFAEQGQVGKELAKSNPDKYIFDEEFNVLQRRDNPNYTILGTDIEYIKARDNKMAEMIIEYQKKSQKPIVVIVGNRHASNIHDQKKLQEQGFGYVYISPTKPATKSGMYS